MDVTLAREDTDVSRAHGVVPLGADHEQWGDLTLVFRDDQGTGSDEVEKKEESSIAMGSSFKDLVLDWDGPDLVYDTVEEWMWTCTFHLAPSFFEKVQIRSSGGPEFWVIRKVRDPQDLIFKTQDLWFQPLIEVLSLHCPPILNFPCAGIPESPKMYQPRQNHHIPQMNKNSSYVKKI